MKESTMFSFKHKLHEELKKSMDKKVYKSFRVLIKYKDLEQNILNKITSYKGILYNSIEPLKIISASLTCRDIERLIEYPEVEYVCLDTFCFLCGTNGLSVKSANRTSLNPQYGLSGKGIGIAIIDSGVFPHSDLNNPNKIALFYDLIKGFNYPYDDNGHGTALSGIICGNGASSKDNFLKGVAPQSHLCVYKAFSGNGRGYASNILYSIMKVLEDSSQFNIKVLCLPFELLEINAFIENLFYKMLDLVASKDIVSIVPSGSNDSIEGSLMGISTFKNVITVAGIDTFKGGYSKYNYSSCGPIQKIDKPDLSAACVNLACLNTSKNFIPERNGVKLYAPHLEVPYTTYTGTSLACAFIAGICGLIFESNPKLSVKDVSSLLKISCRDMNLPKNIQGCGIPDINVLFSSN